MAGQMDTQNLAELPHPQNITGPLGRKVKRVTDVNSMGYNPYEGPGPDPKQQPQQNYYPDLGNDAAMNNSFQQNQGYGAPQPQTFGNPVGYQPSPSLPVGYNYNAPSPHLQPQNSFQVPGNLGVLGQPVVQDMAMQYGQQLAGAGKTIIKQEMEKYVPVTKMKYYFAVDTKYVMSKLILLFFPFTHKDWSVKYEQDGPVQPRFEINAPDLYIPTMAYITYILVAGLVLGFQEKFTPELIGITASSALAWSLVELVVYSATLYIIQVETNLRTLDLLAYAGYKFVGIIISILVSFLIGKTGFYVTLVYTNLALAFFLVRSLKVQVLAERGTQNQQNYYNNASQSTAGHKRRLYFLLFVAGMQPVLSWWLSYHLVPSSVTPIAVLSV